MIFSCKEASEVCCRNMVIVAVFLLCCFAGIVFRGNQCGAVGESVMVDAVNFPDANFRQAVLEQFDSDKNGELDALEVQNAKSLIAGHKDIVDVKGIEMLPNLEIVKLSDNKMSSIDVSQNTKLKTLNLSSNELASIDLRRNLELLVLDLSYNHISSIDVTGNAKLTRLDSFWNPISSIDLKSNVALTELKLQSDEISSIDLKYNKKLRTVTLSSSKLTTLDLSSLEMLDSLNVAGSPLTSLDLSHNPVLRTLMIADSTMTSIDLSHNPQLFTFWSEGDMFTSLDLSHNPNLQYLQIISSRLTMLDVSHNPELRELWIRYSPLVSIDISNNPKIIDLRVSNCYLSAIDMSRNTQINSFFGKDQHLEFDKRILSASDFVGGFELSRVANLRGATIVGDEIVVDSGVSQFSYDYKTNNSAYPLMENIVAVIPVEEPPVPTGVADLPPAYWGVIVSGLLGGACVLRRASTRYGRFRR